MNKDDITIREYIDLRIQQERELRTEWRAMNDHQVKEAKEYVNSKLDKMNEMREQITTERGQYVSKPAFEGKYESMDVRIRLLENTGSNLQGKVAVIGGMIGMAVILIAHFWR